mgnify:FL=1
MIIVTIIVLALVFLIGFFMNYQDNESDVVDAGIFESPGADGTATDILDEEGEEAQTDDIPFEEAVWEYRIDRAMGHPNCPPVPEIEYPVDYYKGRLIDSHFHIANLPDSSPGDEEGEEVFYSAYFGEDNNENNEDGDNDEEEQENEVMPLLGKNIKISDIVCTLEHEGTDKVFAFFPVYPDIPAQMVEVVKRTMDLYPEKFVPFIMAPDSDNSPGGLSTVKSSVLTNMLSIYPGLFKGFGEIGLYPKEGGSRELPPDDPVLRDIYPVVRENKLAVYFHPGENMEDNFEIVLKENPDINFIVHGEQIEKPDEIGALMKKYLNIYFTVNDLYGDKYLLHTQGSTEDFLEALDNYEPLLKKDLATWQKLIEEHPNQFMWGTDRGGIAVWTLDREVGKKITDYGRTFIGKLNPTVRERFAYKNALRAMGEEV